MPGIYTAHHYNSITSPQAGGCVAEIEECVINIAIVVCREKAHTKDSLAVLCAVWVALPTKWHQCSKTATLWLFGC